MAERLEVIFEALDDASAWIPWVTSALLGVVIVHLLRERASRAEDAEASTSVNVPRGAGPTAGADAALHAAGIHVDPSKFVHTIDECPLRGCSRCIRPAT
jgi:hypothetical protein